MSHARVIVVLLVAWTLCACTFRVRESNLVFPRTLPTPALEGLRQTFPDYRVAPTTLQTSDGGTLYVLRLLRPDAVATVLYFGGNGYTISEGAPQTLRSFTAAPVNVVLVDHRGYGASRGKASLDAMMSDAVLVHDRLREDPQLRGLPIIVHGHSLGSFMAGQVADERRLAGLILEGSVTTSEAWTEALRAKQSLGIRLRVRRVVPDGPLAGKGNGGVVTRLDEPVLFVVGVNDDIAPPRLSQALFDATPLPADDKELLVVQGHGHMNAADSDAFRLAFSRFVAKVAAGGQPKVR